MNEFGFVQGGHAQAWADAYDTAACIVDARRAYAEHRKWVDCGFETATSDEEDDDPLGLESTGLWSGDPWAAAAQDGDTVTAAE
eukprot:COSAG01_NODE_31615_length_594_cov_1.850505_1_plen_83_part_10